MSKHVKHVPKHRGAPPRHALAKAPRKALHTTLLLSSVAVAATGVTIAGGLVDTGPTAVTNAAADAGSGADLGARTSDRGAMAADLGDRDATVSRSDTREDSDPAKAAALDADAGEAMTRTESMSEGDPRGIAKALLAEFGFGLDQFGCLDSLWTRESNCEPAGPQPIVGGARHPAIVARLQDGIGGVRLVLQPGHSDSLGPGLHPGPLRQPLRRLVAQPGPRLVLTVRA